MDALIQSVQASSETADAHASAIEALTTRITRHESSLEAASTKLSASSSKHQAAAAVRLLNDGPGRESLFYVHADKMRVFRAIQADAVSADLRNARVLYSRPLQMLRSAVPLAAHDVLLMHIAIPANGRLNMTSAETLTDNIPPPTTPSLNHTKKPNARRATPIPLRTMLRTTSAKKFRAPLVSTCRTVGKSAVVVLLFPWGAQRLQFIDHADPSATVN